MLFTYPSFINVSKQDKSRLLYNNVKIALQTSINEIWYDIQYGVRTREYIKDGIDELVVARIQDNIENCLMNYFSQDILLNYMDIRQTETKIYIDINYTELRTGIHNTIRTEETFINENI